MTGDPDDRTVALILSGGGAYAAYQVGVIRCLCGGQSPATEFRPLRPGIVVGSSAGAVNAAVLASRSGETPTATAEYLARVWLDGLAADPAAGRGPAVRLRGDPTAVAYGSRGVVVTAADGLSLAQEFFCRLPQLFAGGLPGPRRFLELLDLAAVLDVTNFERVVRGAVDLAGVRRSSRALRVLATNWQTGELKVFRNEDMTNEVGHTAVFASAAFPGLRPKMIDGQPYVDGSYLMDKPTLPAWDAGADTMHVIYIDPDVRAIPVRRVENAIEVVDKLYHLTMATIFERDLALVRDINRGLAALARAAAGDPAPGPDPRGLLRLVGRAAQFPGGLAPYRPLTVHRYHPTDDVGGILGVLNFDRVHIAGLIDRGFRDAATHDCAVAGCIFPG